MAKLTRTQRRNRARRQANAGEPKLPPELILKVIDHLVSDEATGPTRQASYTVLTSLCLVNQWFSRVVFPLLYKHVYLLTDARAELFVRTVSSEGWAAKVQADEVRGLIKSVEMVRGLFDRQADVQTQQAKYATDDLTIVHLLHAIDYTKLASLSLTNATLYIVRLGGLSGTIKCSQLDRAGSTELTNISFSRTDQA
jgi:hypothetical protein